MNNFQHVIYNKSNAILDLSTYTRLEGDYRSYGSKLFSSILHSEGAKNEKEEEK